METGKKSDAASQGEVSEQLNLHGEFLGVTSMACYSAPWHLQGVLLCLIGYMFFHRVRARSRSNAAVLEHIHDDPQPAGSAMLGIIGDGLDGEFLKEDEEGHILENFNRMFFGFTVSKRNRAAYWAGFSIYLITCAHVLVVSLREIPQVWLSWFG